MNETIQIKKLQSTFEKIQEIQKKLSMPNISGLDISKYKLKETDELFKIFLKSNPDLELINNTLVIVIPLSNKEKYESRLEKLKIEQSECKKIIQMKFNRFKQLEQEINEVQDKWNKQEL